MLIIENDEEQRGEERRGESYCVSAGQLPAAAAGAGQMIQILHPTQHKVSSN